MMLRSLPANDGFHMPAEFAPQDGVLLVWPVRPGSWGIDPTAAQRAFCDIMREASKSERVYLLADAAHLDEACAQAGEFATILEIETDDAWARDIGPTFVTNGICVRGILPCDLADENAELMGMGAEDDNQACGVCLAMCCWPGLCGLMGAVMASSTRERMRAVYGLAGNGCLDLLIYWCFTPCAVCQEARTLKALQGQPPEGKGAEPVAVQATPPPPQAMAANVEV